MLASNELGLSGLDLLLLVLLDVVVYDTADEDEFENHLEMLLRENEDICLVLIRDCLSLNLLINC